MKFRPYLVFGLIFLASLPIKLATAQNMPFDIDYVPVISRLMDYGLPPVGTLSSVAAYNMPMLQWLHLPAFHLTGNVWWTIMLTLLVWNALGTWAVFQVSKELFGTVPAYATAAIFTFSEGGISSSYTAWAQLLLPTFFALTIWALWTWRSREKGIYLALAGVIATAAFMTHFSAILLYPAMLIFAVLSRAKWQWRWLIVGAIAAVLMLMPYLLFELNRDFIDLKAFLSQDSLVEEETLNQYRIYEAGYQPPSPENQAQSTATRNETPSPSPTNPSRLERAMAYAFDVPMLMFNALHYAFPTGSQGIETLAPFVSPITQVIFYLPSLLFWLSIPLALWQFWKVRSWDVFVNTEAGRFLLLFAFLLTILLLMALTRTLDDTTYLTGFLAVQAMMLGFVFNALPHPQTPSPILKEGAEGRPRRSGGIVSSSLLIFFIFIYCCFQVGERAGRLIGNDDSQFSAYNVSLYRHVEMVVDAIAADWDGGESISVSYDILPEMPNLWWTPAWHSIDPSYRMGMTFDLLLELHHGLVNSNQDPVGRVDNADYLVIYAPAAARYDLSQYEVWDFGAIWLLKPN